MFLTFVNLTRFRTVIFPGPNKIDVTYEGMKVPNSPFTVGVTPGCDPSRVKVYGPGILIAKAIILIIH